MRKTNLQRRILGFGLCVMLLLVMPLPVSASAAEAPNAVGMNLGEAEGLLSAYGEVIVTYAYSDTVAADVVMEQSIQGDAIQLQVSLGTEPQEELYAEESEPDKLGSFGLSAYNRKPPIGIDGEFGDWHDKPHAWEFDWDNSDSCWHWGVWGNGLEGYKTPEGTFDNKVRHKVSFVIDGEYAYVYVQMARVSGSYLSGTDYNFYDSQGNMAKFSIVDEEGKVIWDAAIYEPGKHNFTIIHGAGEMAWSEVEGAEVCVFVHEDRSNTEIEMKIPLSQMTNQNSKMIRDNMGLMHWTNPHLCSHRFACGGADTAPFVTAGIAMVGVPLCTTLLNRKVTKRRKREEHNE